MRSLQLLASVTLGTLLIYSCITIVSSGIDFKIPLLFFNLQKNHKQHSNPQHLPNNIRQPNHLRPHSSLISSLFKSRPRIPPSPQKPQSPPIHNHPHPHVPQQQPHLHIPQPHHIPQPQPQRHQATSIEHEQGPVYLHDPESTVNFYFKENLFGPAKRLGIHHDGCREVPTNQWHQKPKSLWAKHCITIFQNGHCHGAGVQVAGMVHELRSAGMHYGVTSFKPCEKNIRIRFEPDNKHHHNHLH